MNVTTTTALTGTLKLSADAAKDSTANQVVHTMDFHVYDEDN
jgi:hypothetical protein